MCGKPNVNSAFDKLRHYESAEAMILGLSPIPCFSAAMFNLVLLFCFAVFEAQQQTQADNLLAPPSQAQWQRGQHNFHLHTSGFESGPLYTRSQGNVQPKSSIPIGAKVEISPKGFTLGVKAEIEKNFSICPKY